jgi:hypothetical protein
MKQLASFIRIVVIFTVALLVVTELQAQEATESKGRQLDTRVWSQAYWLKMAKLGLVDVAPPIPCKEALYTSSRIEAPGVLSKDSPDVPVTHDPNTTQSENSVFVHPFDINTVLNSNNSTDWDGVEVGVLYGADALFTTDGGQTWGGSIQAAAGSNNGDPAAAIGLNGWFYVGYIAANLGQGVAHSTDAGDNWTHVQVASGGLLDKNHLWIDNSSSSPYEGNLYSAWTNFFGANDNEIELSRSTDGGLSWSSPINISSAVGAGSHNQGVNIQTGPNGEVYAAWSIYDSWSSDETAIGFAKSADGGATFEPATRIIENIRGIRFTHTSKLMRVNSFPVMAVDISGGPNHGTIYIVWANIGVPGENIGPDIDIYMIKSTDGGSNWSTPVKVNQDPSGLGKEHYFPWITCDPVCGVLCVIFYDDRNVASTDCEVFVAVSEDAGQSWSDFKVSDVSFTPSPIPGLAEGYFGDYLGISARSGKVYPAWTDNRDGRAMTYVSPFVVEQDSIPPDAVTDLAVTDVGSNWISLTWTASGDDGDSGTASSYDIRYSTSPIDEGNFDLATPVSDPPIPQEAGSLEILTVDGLDFNTIYFFALKVRDEWGNASGVSNSPWGITLGIPDINVFPDSLVAYLLLGQTETQTLIISNVGEDPSTLDFSLPQFGGGTSLRVRSAEGDHLRFEVIPMRGGNLTEHSPVRRSGKAHRIPQGQGSSYPLFERLMSNLSKQNIIFFDDMESGVNGWTTQLYGGTTDDLWHQTNITYNSPVTSWWCGIEGQGNYDTGNQINTAAISPSIDLSLATAPITLEFFENYDTEPGWDFCMVDVSTNGGMSWTPLRGDLGSAPSGSSGRWIMSVLDLSEFKGEVIQIRFYFDTRDRLNNDYPGWFFDDVLVTAAGYVFLSVEPVRGTVLANESETLCVTFDATEVPIGDYDLDIEIFSNDPDEPEVIIPTHLHVTEAMIILLSPRENELNVLVNTNISVTFAMDMDETTINDSTFVVNAMSTGLHQGTITYDSQTKTATLDPLEDFDEGEAVTVVLTTDIQSSGGIPLQNGYIWSFTTGVNGGYGTFVPQSIYSVDDSPASVFAADFDGDGDQDLATANAYSNNVSVLLNNGDGTFPPDSVYSVDDEPWSVFAADLDGDGDLDLATASAFFGDVSVLLNKGDGTFAPHSVYPVGDGPRSIFAADLDVDGHLDLATANAYSDNVSVMLNNGDGSFATHSLYPVGDDPYSLFAADLDGDGDLDLTTGNLLSDNVSVLLNNGDGTFAPHSVYPVDDGPIYVFAADLDADGDQDLATANAYYADVSVLLNNGDGTFAPHSVYPVGDDPYSLFAADLDGDGDLDLTTANSGSDNLSVLLNNGNGTFPAHSVYPVGDDAQSIFAADLDGDGDLDLTTANLGSDNVSVLLNHLPGDCNGDGAIDIGDVVHLLNYLFIGGPAPKPLPAGDANCDGMINVGDAIYLANYVFIGGPPPGC